MGYRNARAIAGPGASGAGLAAARPLRCQSALTSGMTIIHSGGTNRPT